MNQNGDANGFQWFEWMESAAGTWLSAARGWQDMLFSPAKQSMSEDYAQASLGLWRACLFPWGGMDASPGKEKGRMDGFEAFFRVMGPGAMGQDISRLLWANMPGAGLESVQQDAVRVWTDIYERVVQPLLKVPRVGLTRVLQEKLSALADKFNTYQATVSEFQMLLSGPMDRAFADLKEELEKGGTKGRSEEDYHVYYGMWIKKLEQHYMTLFRSEEYRAALSRLLDETADFRISGNDVLSEFLQFLPVPTNREMDDLYREVYTLKKALKESSKKIKNLESAYSGEVRVEPAENMSQGGLQ
ncbi:MAG: poly(R)-hydroxyalkanoic acid synthase subunit PhaE [Syntrophobacteraceae bacterium]